MGHKNAPLTPEGRRRLIERVLSGRPIAHVADEGGVSRQTLSKWVARYLAHGEAGLEDRSSRPESQPKRTPDDIEQMVIALRQATKWGPDRISAFLRDAGDGEVGVSAATVWRILQRNGMNTLRLMDVPTGETKRAVNRYEHANPGDMVHIDVKKVGRIPDGGGWFVHGRGTDEARKSNRVANRRPGKAHIHAAVDDHSRLAYAEVHPDEKKETASAFWVRTVAFYRRHGIDHIARCLTDNGPAYRSKLFNDTLDSTGTTHKYTRPHTPRTNGKVERFNQTMKVEWLYVRSYMSDDERTAALAEFLNHYNHERPHSALGNKPPASRVPETSFRIAPQPAEFDSIEPYPEEYLF